MEQAPESPLIKVWERSAQDPDFRARLIADPQTTLRDEMGIVFPEGMEIEIVENTPEKTVVVLPMVDEEVEFGDLDEASGFGFEAGGNTKAAWCYHINWYADPNPSIPNSKRMGGGPDTSGPFLGLKM